MTFPNPANYYLPTPQQFEAEITALDQDALGNYLSELAYLVPTGNGFFVSEDLSDDCDSWVSSLSEAQLVDLIRWVAERLAWFHLPQTIRAKEAFS
jgi:hypothetical protein